MREYKIASIKYNERQHDINSFPYQKSITDENSRSSTVVVVVVLFKLFDNKKSYKVTKLLEL